MIALPRAEHGDESETLRAPPASGYGARSVDAEGVRQAATELPHPRPTISSPTSSFATALPRPRAGGVRPALLRLLAAVHLRVARGARCGAPAAGAKARR